MALFHVLLLVALVHGGTSDEICESCGADSAFLQLQVSKEKTLRSNQSKYWQPTKSVDQNRSGDSRANGLFPLPTALDWEFTAPGIGFPVLDDESNVYVGSESGKIFSFDQHGTKRWEANGTAKVCQSPVLFSGTLYIGCGDGSALALDMKTGERLWRSRVSWALPYESFTMGVTKDHIFMPAGAKPPDISEGPFHPPIRLGSPAVVMLRRLDGQVLWKFDLAENDFVLELLPCMLSDSVIFSGLYATIYRLSLDGHLMWKSHLGSQWHTAAQVSCREDGTVLVGLGEAEVGAGFGGEIKALDMETGNPLWSISLPHAVYTPIAVGQIKGYDGTAIIAPMGVPGFYPNVTTGNHTVWALDPSTGKMIWSFQTPSMTVRGSRGSTLQDMCAPQAWSTPIISKDGTVFINWAFGGITYALRDSNQDGVCDLDDPDEVSSFDFGIGNYGGPALAPSMLAVRTCHGPRVLSIPSILYVP